MLVEIQPFQLPVSVRLLADIITAGERKGDGRTSMPNELRNFLALTYDELEDLNLEAKEQRRNRVPIGKI
ncbi:MAG: hypothetical protein WAM69_15530, partial [Candidatus Sulfotelmatobacter sp.]